MSKFKLNEKVVFRNEENYKKLEYEICYNVEFSDLKYYFKDKINNKELTICTIEEHYYHIGDSLIIEYQLAEDISHSRWKEEDLINIEEEKVRRIMNEL